MNESHDLDIARVEARETKENEAFKRLYDITEVYLAEHLVLVNRIQGLAKDFEGIDFTEDFNTLLKEAI